MKYKHVDEAVKMGLNVTSSGTRTVPTLKGGKEFHAVKRFTLMNNTSAFSRKSAVKLSIQVGDKFFNLPGGIFWKSQTPVQINGETGHHQYGIQITRSEANIKAIIKNTSKWK